MSTALIRGNMLTQLANRGETMAMETKRLVRDFLADKPGAWMPEDFLAPYELVERSLDDATKDGRHLILRTIHQLLSELFFDVKVRKLTEAESRQLISAMFIAGKYELIEGTKYTSVIEFIYRYPDVFWGRVVQISDLTSDKRHFLKFLMKNIPDNIQDFKKNRIGVFSCVEGLFGRGKKVKLKRAFLNGAKIDVEMQLNGRPYKAVVVRINNRDKALIDVEELPKIHRRPSHKVTKLGEIIIDEATPRNIANAAFTRFNDLIEV